MSRVVGPCKKLGQTLTLTLSVQTLDVKRNYMSFLSIINFRSGRQTDPRRRYSRVAGWWLVLKIYDRYSEAQNETVFRLHIFLEECFVFCVTESLKLNNYMYSHLFLYYGSIKFVESNIHFCICILLATMTSPNSYVPLYFISIYFHMLYSP